jgi:hypothetical protein
VGSAPERRVQGLFHLQRVPQVRIRNDEGRVAFTRLGVVESDAAVDSVVAAARAAGDPESSDTAQEERGASAP